MDSSLLKLALIAAALTGHSVVAAQDDAKTLPISLEADSSSFDRQSSLMHFQGLRITQGEMRIEADQALASDINFEKSEWRFTGNVQIHVNSALLKSDSAVFQFVAHQLATGELTGAPASFVDQSTGHKEPASGTANKISYDYVQRILRMSQNASLTKGQNQIRGCDLIYDFDEEEVTSGSSDCGERFQIVIVPPPESAATDSAPNP